MKDTCETCRFRFGFECKRRAPQLFQEPANGEVITRFPFVLLDHWCGEHEQDPALVQSIRRRK